MIFSTADLHLAVPYAASLGVEVVVGHADNVRLRVAWAEDRCTAGDSLHGGVIMALADTSGAVCAFLNLPEGSTATTTIESKTNFFRPVRDGWTEAHSHPLHLGRSTIVVETDVEDHDGRLVARVTQTQAVLR
ncbi:MAG: PaaI family thioesterase [Actinomycetota bacterium]|nr:PaaI family thioesterase [Actinomycetota bacterium]